MSKLSTPADLSFISDKKQMEIEDFLQQDEQEILQLIEKEFQQLLKEPSEITIQNILAYARLS